MTKAFFALLPLLIVTSAALAAVKPNSLFSEGAVLQQGIKVPVWGTAADGEEVTVEFQGQTVSTTARNGFWMVKLDPLKAGGPFTMKINDLEIKNILVGEVWVCSGQSNMAWPLSRTENAETAIASADDPMLRLFLVPKQAYQKVLPEAWKECTPESAANFSAVGYYFGKHLRETLKVPVGLIDSSVGGTPVEAWTSLNVVKATGIQTPVRRAYLYNSMIAPLLPYGIRGAIWYQGESNAPRAKDYRTLFPTMIKNWRDAWGLGDFPFLFVQIAPYARNLPEGTWAFLREAQLLTALNVPNTAMAVITDLGEEKEIHPQKKEPVGGRLALAARVIAYGEKIIYSGPIYKSMEIQGDKIVLSFDHVGGGLVAKDGPLMGFTISGADGNFIQAKAEIAGDKVVVSSPEVKNPKAVRYGWTNWMVVNLFNKEGLPASPFRTDSD